MSIELDRWRAEPNALSRAVEALRARGVPFVDLTASNPTTADIAYPADLLTGLSDARALRYDPHPFGLPAARAAVAADFARRGAIVDPARLVLCASTSEAYSWLFKLLCRPGDAVLVPRPSYPLFEHLTALEHVRALPYRLDYHGRWEIDLATIEAAAGVRALLLVSPNNPTGSYVSPGELARLVTLSRDRGWALVADEVFADYPLEVEAPVTDLAARADVLTFTLGGASKTLGLPQVKLAWILAGGPPRELADALAGLELIADTYLSVSTPVQVAAPGLLQHGAGIRGAIRARIAGNLRAAREIARRFPACDVQRVEGGWSAIVRVPATRSEESFVLDLLQRERILVHPGYFFDMPHEAFAVVSLLPSGDVFADALERMMRMAVA